MYGVIFLLAFYYALTYALHGPFIDPIKAVTVLINGIYRVLGYETAN